MDSSHETLLWYTKVRWLSKGNVLLRVYNLREEIKVFLETKKSQYVCFFEDAKWCSCLAYLADIFEKLNLLNLKLQERQKRHQSSGLRENLC